MLKKNKFLNVVLALTLLIIVLVSPGWQKRGLAAPDEQAKAQDVQIVFVTDVSGSMGYYVLSKDLPMDLAIMRNRLNEIQDNSHYQELTEQLKEISEDPAYLAAQTAYSEAYTAQSLWLIDHDYPDLDTLYFELEDKFAELGCAGGYADLYESVDLNEARQYVNEACKFASLSQEQTESVVAMVAFLSDAEYQSLRQETEQLEGELSRVRASLGYDQIRKEIEQFLSITSYYDLEARINLRAKELGYPYRLELAKQTAEIIVDLSRLDQISNQRQSSLGLVRFANLGKLIQPLTDDYDLMKNQIEELGFYGATNVGIGLQLALEELEQNGDPQRPSAIVLLSDGEANRGLTAKQILTEIPPLARQLNTRICAVGFGNREADIDAELLQSLAKETDGNYAFAQTGDELVSFYTACRQSLIADSVTQLSGLARGGETVEAGDLPVAENTDVLEVTLTYLSGEMELVLVDPTGQVVDASYPGVDIQTQENVQLITVKNPLPDQWAVRVRSGEAEGESFVYNITIGAQANPNPPSPATATSTSAPPPTPAPAATSQPEPEEDIAGALSDIATPAFCIGGLLLLVALGGIAGFFVYLRRREVAVRPIHVIASAGVLILVIACWLGALGGLLGLSNQGESLRAIVSGATATPAATSTPAFSATPEATPTMTSTPTHTPPPPPTHTPTPTATPVPIALGPENIDQLSLRENVLDNTIAGFQSSAFFALALSPDGAMIATDGYYCPTNDCQVFVKLLQILPEGIIPLQGMVDPEMPGDQWIGIYDLDFAPDGATLASAWADNKIRIWNIADGSLARSIEAHTGVVRSLDFTSDGVTLASGSEDKTVKLWDVATGSELLSFRAANYDVYAIEFSPDDSLLAVTARDRDAFLKLYRTSDGRVERSLSGHTNTPFCLAFSPDGRLLASGNYDGNILVHEVATGRLLYTLKGHTGIVWGVDFSNDGALLASAGADNTVRIWDMNDGQLLRTLEDHRSRVLKAIFSPDDSFLLSAAEFDALLLWGIQP